MSGAGAPSYRHHAFQEPISCRPDGPCSRAPQCSRSAPSCPASCRGPLRPRGADEASDPVTGLFGIGIATRGARRATDDEQRDTLATAGIFLVVGLWLIVLGILVDGSADVV